jgi:hypothetical protein
MKQTKKMKIILPNIIVTTLLIFMFEYSNCQANLSLEKKAGKIIAELKNNDKYPPGAKDTLIDLNGDHYKDILIEYNGSAGSGMKNKVAVYLYNKAAKKYFICQQLCDLANPTFYFDKKVVTGYYITPGGGDAIKLKWENLHLDSLEKINVLVKWGEDSIPRFNMTVYNFVSGQTTTNWQNLFSLPKEYKYLDYSPLIKNKN